MMYCKKHLAKAIFALGLSFWAAQALGGACGGNSGFSFGAEKGIVIVSNFTMEPQRDERFHALLLLDAASTGPRTVYRTDDPNAGVEWATLRPKPNDTVAFIDRRSGDPLTTYALVLITLDGKEVKRIPDGRDAVWSPDGRMLAYITGRNEESFPDFRTTGTWIYDMASDAGTQVHTGGYDLFWAQHDGNLYIDTFGEGVCKYDIQRQTLQDTPFHGIYFSPDGKYYYSACYEGDDVRLYQTDTNEDVTARWDFLAYRTSALRPLLWLDAHTLAFATSSFFSRSNYVLNLNDGSVREVPASVVGLMADGRTVLAHKDGQLARYPLGGLPLVPPEIVNPSSPAPSGEARLTHPLVDEIPLPSRVTGLQMSPSGKHVAIRTDRASDHVVTVYADANAPRVYVESLPVVSGSWQPDDLLRVEVPKADKWPIMLPPYDKVAPLREVLDKTPSVVGALDRLSVAAWMYCENASHPIAEFDGQRVFNTVEGLSNMTRQSFVQPPQPNTLNVGPASASLQQLSAASKTYFINENRTDPPSHQLFLVEGETKADVTGPMKTWIRPLHYDSEKRRAYARVGAQISDLFVCSMDTGIRQTFLSRDPDTRATVTHYPVYGEDYLVTVMNPDGSPPYVSPWIKIYSVDGPCLQTIPTVIPGAQGLTRLDAIGVSRRVIAVAVSAKLPNGNTKALLRVYRAGPPPQAEKSEVRS